MTAALAAFPTLTLADVEQLEQQTRANLSGAIDTLTRLREGHADALRGYDSWPAYLVACFGDLLAQLRFVKDDREQRRALVAHLVEQGKTVGEIQAFLGVARGTVANDRAALGLARPTGPRPKVARPWGQRWQVAAEHLRRRGDDGLTLVELASAMSITEGAASGLLSYLGPPDDRHPQRKGLAVRTERRRGGQRVHVHS